MTYRVTCVHSISHAAAIRTLERGGPAQVTPTPYLLIVGKNPAGTTVLANKGVVNWHKEHASWVEK